MNWKNMILSFLTLLPPVHLKPTNSIAGRNFVQVGPSLPLSSFLEMFINLSKLPLLRNATRLPLSGVYKISERYRNRKKKLKSKQSWKFIEIEGLKKAKIFNASLNSANFLSGELLPKLFISLAAFVFAQIFINLSQSLAVLFLQIPLRHIAADLCINMVKICDPPPSFSLINYFLVELICKIGDILQLIWHIR